MAASNRSVLKNEQARKTPANSMGGEAIRDRIVEASIRYMRVHGSDRLNMMDVANLAGVSRATLYNYFGSKERLLLAAEEAVAEKFNAGMRMEIDKHDNLVDRVVAIALYMRRAFSKESKSPWFGFLSPLDEAKMVVSTVAPAHRDFIAMFKHYIVVAQKNGEVAREIDPKEAAEWVVRIVFSYAFEPPEKYMGKAAHVRRMFEQFLIPGVGVR